MRRGATHTEYIRAYADGRLYFLETAARVGGANIAEAVEFATGINLWAEWARIEVAQLRGEPYQLPPVRAGYAGVINLPGAPGMARPGRLCRSRGRVADGQEEPRRADRRLAGCRPGGSAAERIQRALCPRLFGCAAAARQTRALTLPATVPTI